MESQPGRTREVFGGVQLLNAKKQRLTAENLAMKYLFHFNVEHAKIEIKNIRSLQLNDSVWECNADVYVGTHLMDNGKPRLCLLWSVTSAMHYKLEITDSGQLYLTILDEQHHGNDPVRE